MSKLIFLTDAHVPLFIVVSKVTQVLGGIIMVATALMSVIDRAGGSIEYDSKKEVNGESIVVLS